MEELEGTRAGMDPTEDGNRVACNGLARPPPGCPADAERETPEGNRSDRPEGLGDLCPGPRLARDMVSRLPIRERRPRPRILRLDLRSCRGEHHAFVQLFRSFDRDFGGQGFSSEYLACLLMRRFAAEETPAVVWLDNIPSQPDFSILWRTFLKDEGPAQCAAVILSGEIDPTRRLPLNDERRVDRFVLQQLGPEKLLEALEAMAVDAFTTPPSIPVLLSVRDRLLSRGWGLSMGAFILKRSGERAELRGAEMVEEKDLPTTRTGPRVRDPALIDSILMEGARATPQGKGMGFGALSLHLRRRLAAQGLGFPSISMIRRHVIRLEASGLLERRVRVGGSGGSQSLIRPSPYLEPGIKGIPVLSRSAIPAGPGPRYGSPVSYPGRPSVDSRYRGRAGGIPRSFQPPSQKRG